MGCRIMTLSGRIYKHRQRRGTPFGFCFGQGLTQYAVQDCPLASVPRVLRSRVYDFCLSSEFPEAFAGSSECPDNELSKTHSWAGSTADWLSMYEFNVYQSPAPTLSNTCCTHMHSSMYTQLTHTHLQAGRIIREKKNIISQTYEPSLSFWQEVGKDAGSYH